MDTQLATSAPPASTALAIAGSAQLAPGNENIAVSAFTPTEMVESNARLIQWFTNKIEAQKAEAAELRAAADHAKAQKWKVATLNKHASLAEKRVTYFEKIKAALEAGYYIVPNFPVVCFAVRTDKNSPKGFKSAVCSYKPGYAHEQGAEALPPGQGEYWNPYPVVVEEVIDHNDKGTPIWHSTPDRWDDIAFPLNMAKVEIMEATTRAMTLKLFDSFGILPGRAKRDDPMIIGTISSPKTPAYSGNERDHVSFVIGWHFDTSIL